MSFTAKSVIFDIADCHGTTIYAGIRQIDFYFEGSKLVFSNTDYAAYATVFYNASYVASNAFDQSLILTGSYQGTQWLATSGSYTNLRIVIVFNSLKTFDAIRVNNSHHIGTQTETGVNNVKINISTDIITSTVYNEAISNSTLIFDSTFDQHISSNVADPQILTLQDGTIDTPEIPVTTSVTSGIQIQIDTPEIPVTTSVLSGIFTGIGINTPEIITNTDSVSDLQLSFSPPEIPVTTSVTSGIQIQIDTPEIPVTTSVLSGIFTGIFIITPEIPVITNIDFDLKLFLETPEISITTTINNNTGIKLVAPEIIVTTSITGEAPIFFTTEHAEVYYLFTLTGAADSISDIEIPISSFQCRKRSGDPTYLSVVIPDIEYAEQISDRANGTLQIEMAYKQDGMYLQRAVIVQGDLDSISIDEGGSNQSITLTGYKTETFIQKTVMMKDPTFRSVRSGSLRYRFAEPNINLQPGDIVKVGSDTYTADLISYAISADSQQLEVSEA